LENTDREVERASREKKLSVTQKPELLGIAGIAGTDRKVEVEYKSRNYREN